MFGHVIWVDKYIIQIDYNTNIQNIREKIIYESLESHMSIGKTEGYYRPFGSWHKIIVSYLSSW